MGDKINRLTSITKSGVTMVESESIRDTLIDLHNYAAMAIMLMDEKSTKPDKEEPNMSKTITLGLPKMIL